MTDIDTSVLTPPAARTPALRYLSCLRISDILVLQGPPLLGAAFAIRHPSAHNLGMLATLMAANLFLITHIFMLNDWAGLTTDAKDPNRASRVFTARGVGRGELGGLTAGFLVVSLLLFIRLGAMTLALSLAIASLSALYSLPRFDWKGKPLLNSAAHLAGGILHFLLGYSLGRAIDGRGLATAAFFALVFTAGHLTQEIRDCASDAVNGIRTNAVAFGARVTFTASLALFAIAQMLLLVLALTGVLPRSLAAVIAVFPMQVQWSLETLRDDLTYARISRLQTRYRSLYAVIGVAMVVALYA
jgi:4-hydroxybenzoate polyprenyltransferase